MEIKFEAHYRYGNLGDEKDFWEGSIDSDNFEYEIRLLAEKELKNKDRRIFKIIWK